MEDQKSKELALFGELRDLLGRIHETISPEVAEDYLTGHVLVDKALAAVVVEGLKHFVRTAHWARTLDNNIQDAYKGAPTVELKIEQLNDIIGLHQRLCAARDTTAVPRNVTLSTKEAEQSTREATAILARELRWLVAKGRVSQEEFLVLHRQLLIRGFMPCACGVYTNPFVVAGKTHDCRDYPPIVPDKPEEPEPDEVVVTAVCGATVTSQLTVSCGANEPWLTVPVTSEAQRTAQHAAQRYPREHIVPRLMRNMTVSEGVDEEEDWLLARRLQPIPRPQPPTPTPIYRGGEGNLLSRRAQRKASRKRWR